MLVLASTSKYRAALLERLRVPFETADPPYVEENAPDADPVELVREQALGKARSLADRFPGSVIIGGDQVAELDGEILTKPGTRENAAAQLTRLAGRVHRLRTAIAVVDTRGGRGSGDRSGSVRESVHVDTTEISIRPLSAEEIDAYIALDDPVDCAGSYKAEAAGPTIFEFQRGDDPTAVIGLPLIALCRMLREHAALPPGGNV